jgi:hypothetical protein
LHPLDDKKGQWLKGMALKYVENCRKNAIFAKLIN